MSRLMYVCNVGQPNSEPLVPPSLVLSDEFMRNYRPGSAAYSQPLAQNAAFDQQPLAPPPALFADGQPAYPGCDGCHRGGYPESQPVGNQQVDNEPLVPPSTFHGMK